MDAKTGAKIIKEDLRKTFGKNVGRVVVRIGQWCSRSKFRTQQVSETTLATPRYSASALDLETVGCCLADQEIRLSPKKTQ